MLTPKTYSAINDAINYLKVDLGPCKPGCGCVIHGLEEALNDLGAIDDLNASLSPEEVNELMIRPLMELYRARHNASPDIAKLARWVIPIVTRTIKL